MRIYIAHPYTGDEERNRERALKAEELLRKATPQTVFYNPVGRMSVSKQFAGVSYAGIMVHCLGELARCDGVVFCGDWAKSTGCRIEAQVAQRLSLPRWYGVGAYAATWAQVESKAEQEEKMAIWQRQHAYRSLSRFFAMPIAVRGLRQQRSSSIVGPSLPLWM